MTGTKICSMCGMEKPTYEFYKRSRAKDGLQTWCKKCTKKKNAEWYKNNKAYANERNRKWARNNYAHRKEYHKKYVELHKEEIKAKSLARYYRDLEQNRLKNRERAKRYLEKRKAYAQTHREQIREWNRKSQEKHREERRRYYKQYRKENRDTINMKRLERLRGDPLFARAHKLRGVLREGISIAERGGRSNKKSIFHQVTALYPNELWEYLRETWEKRYGAKWNGEPYHIDHITPICSAQTIQEMDNLFHYSNLQLLTPGDNTKKRKDDIKFKNTKPLQHTLN